ncbi:hypothetical protein IWW54_001436 [Coemansia sp. RSA 2705]|nr:hypothetical protein IWW54_001436 [Coemansia sp. RSA 2705]
MSKRRGAWLDDDSRVDCIYVGTEFPTEREKLRQQQREQRKTVTTGSKEGWTPTAAFVSSRSNRVQRKELQPADFMDDEDLADQRAARVIEVNQGYSNSNKTDATEVAVATDGGIVDLMASRISAELGAIQIRNDRVGDRIMAAMGWKPGQGVGPLTTGQVAGSSGQRLPPRPTQRTTAIAKLNRHGIGYGVDLANLPADPNNVAKDTALPKLGTLFARKSTETGQKAKKSKAKKINKQRLSFGTLDDDDDGEEDSDDYYSGKHSSLRTKVASSSQLQRMAANPRPKPTLSTPSLAAVKCHDGRPPLAGFLLAEVIAPSANHCSELAVPSTYTGTRSRGKSRWDAVPAQGAESRLGTSAAGKPTLVTAEDRAKLGVMEPHRSLQPAMQEAHLVDPATAKAALSGFMPYSDDAAKQARYREYLKCAVQPTLGHTFTVVEAAEFARMAHVFRPNTAMLARFAAAGSMPETAEANNTPGSRILLKSVTRTVHEWVPSRMLCKRMGITPPAQTIVKTDLQNAQCQEQSGNRRARAADFMDLGNLDSAAISLVPANDLSSNPDLQPRPDMTLFRSIFGSDA